MPEHPDIAVPSHFQHFTSSVKGIALPEKFDYPFFYQPHPIALIAAAELQDYLQHQTDWEHDFGMDNEAIIGKMFGVLVVLSPSGELGYLCAVSGKLAGHNRHEKFVPPVFDILEEDGFFRRGEAVITEINHRIDLLEQHPDYLHAVQALRECLAASEEEKSACKQRNKERKDARDRRRVEIEEMDDAGQREFLLQELSRESMDDHYRFKELNLTWKKKTAEAEERLAHYQREIDALKEERKTRSAELQNEIFDHYSFLNIAQEKKSLGEIFKNTADGRPIAGAGECAAPKLLQYAFLHQLKPIALAEFWWGQSPKTEVRIHGHYYPACRGKCEPILGHMLQGMDVEENPLLKNPAEGKDIEIVWEDEHLLVVYKPHEFLSVPGKSIDDSVLTRLQQTYPEATGPMLVHRLDMSTSGLMLAAKTEEVYKDLQRQFLEREVQKRYVALLEGIVEEDEGWIDLPLRVDLENRPRQMVCYTYGKPARTRWKVIGREEGRTRVHFFPITGRTHQLRVHAAHAEGLQHPIAGDDLYGRPSSRLFLHAERIEFRHPVTGRKMAMKRDAEF